MINEDENPAQALNTAHLPLARSHAATQPRSHPPTHLPACLSFSRQDTSASLRSAIEAAGGLAALEADPDKLQALVTHAGADTQLTMLKVGGSENPTPYSPTHTCILNPNLTLSTRTR